LFVDDSVLTVSESGNSCTYCVETKEYISFGRLLRLRLVVKLD